MFSFGIFYSVPHFLFRSFWKSAAFFIVQLDSVAFYSMKENGVHLNDPIWFVAHSGIEINHPTSSRLTVIKVIKSGNGIEFVTQSQSICRCKLVESRSLRWESVKCLYLCP